MKKIFCTLLTLILVVSFCVACGAVKAPSYDEFSKKAIELGFEESDSSAMSSESINSVWMGSSENSIVMYYDYIDNDTASSDYDAFLENLSSEESLSVETVSGYTRADLDVSGGHVVIILSGRVVMYFSGDLESIDTLVGEFGYSKK